MKRLPDPVAKVNAFVLGLDVHKKITVWVLLDRKGRFHAEGEIRSTPESLEELYRRIIGRKKVHVAFEASGGSHWVFDACERLLKTTERIHVAHPKSVKAIANSTQKNDRNDAWWLAYLTFEGRLPEVWVPCGIYRDLRLATRERTAYVQERTRTYKRIHAEMRQLGHALPKGKLKSAVGRQELRDLLPALPPTVRWVLEDAPEHVAHLTARIETWEARIQSLSAQLPEVALLQERLPGIGKVLAPTIMAESGPVLRFRSAKAYGRYTGLAPSERSSAGRTRFGKISREGNPHLRWALTQAVTACLKQRGGAGWAVGHWVRCREGRLGCRKKAIVAAARKLAEAIWRLFTLGEDFDLRHMFGWDPRAMGEAS